MLEISIEHKMKKLHTIITYLLSVGNGQSTPTDEEEFVEALPIISRETQVAVSPVPTQYMIRYCGADRGRSGFQRQTNTNKLL